MDKIIEEVFKIFNLLAREVQIYFFSGVVIALNILLIDHIYSKSSFLAFIQAKSLTIPSMVVIYLLGQFCMAFYHLVFVRTGLEKRTWRFLPKDLELDRKVLPKIYKKNPEVYVHFIDRLVIQILVRCTICAACIINVIMDVSFLITMGSDWRVWLAFATFIIGAIIFYFIASQIETETQESIDCINSDYERFY